MPRDKQYDFSIDDGESVKGFLLWRFADDQNARAWTRRQLADTATQRSQEDLKFSRLPDELEFAATYNDFSGGFGFAYRTLDHPDGIHWSENMDVRFPNQAVHCQNLQLLPQAQYASTNINADWFIDVPLPGVNFPPDGAGAVLAVGKGYIASYTPTHLSTIGSMFDRIYEASGGALFEFGHRPATFGSYTYIPNLMGTSFHRRGHNGLTYTLGPNQQAEVFLNSGDRLSFLWRDTGGCHYRTIAQGVANDMMATANYSATLNVGPGFLRPLDAIDRDRQVFVGMANGLHAGDVSGTFVNVLPEISQAQHQHNGRDLAVYNGEIQVPHIAGMWSFKPSNFVATARETSPANRGDRSPIHGHFHAVTALGPWVYGGLKTASTSYILAGRDLADGTRRWNVMQRTPHFAEITRIHFDGITSASNGLGISTRMWVGTTTGATSPLYVSPIPLGNDNPLGSDPLFTANYIGSARIDFGRDDRGAPLSAKTYRVCEVRADNLLSGYRYGDVFYTIDGGTRTYLGRAQESPVSRLFFPGVNGQFVSGQDLEVSLESYTASTNISPVYYEVIVRGTLRPRTVDEITAIIHVADDMRDRRGNPMPPAAEQMASLRALAQTANPVRLDALGGDNAWVLIQPNIQENEAYQVGEQTPQLQVTARMAVLEFTGNSVSTWDMIGAYTWNTVGAYTWAQVLNLPAI